MGWEIPRIRIKVPEIRAPRAPRTMTKPARVPRVTGAGGRLRDFDLTIFSANRKTKGITQIEVIRELLASGGNRTKAAEKLGISDSTVFYHTKNIRNLTDAQLRPYANQLGVTIAKIRIACADMTSIKNITHLDIIKALLASGGNRAQAAGKLGIASSGVSKHIKNIRRLPEARLQEYAAQLGTTVAKIKNICPDISPKKNINNIDILKALIKTGGNRREAASIIGVGDSSISRHTQSIRTLPEARLQEYANQLNTTAAKIKSLCADLTSQKGVSHIAVLRELFMSGGNKTLAADRLKISTGALCQHAKNIRRLPDAQLQEHAGRLNTTVAQIRNICADTISAKGVTHIDVIKALIETGGNRAQAAEKLKIATANITKHTKNIRHLRDAQLQEYARQLNTAIEQIRTVCADLNSQKGLSHIDVIKALIETGGNRADAAAQFEISPGVVGRHAVNIRHLPGAQLQKYANQLSGELNRKITVRDILDVVSPRREGKINFERKKEMISALIAFDGNRTMVSKKLKVGVNTVSYHTKNIRNLPDAQLRPYAKLLGVTVEQIRAVCADFDRTKAIGHIEIIKALLASGGSRAQAALKLKVTNGVVGLHAKNIRRLTDEQLKPHARQLNTTIEQIRTVCADLGNKKGITHIEVLREMIAAGGDKTKAAKSLKIRPSVTTYHIKNIMKSSDAKLREYAAQLGITVDRIKEVCAPILKQTKKNLFGK